VETPEVQHTRMHIGEDLWLQPLRQTRRWTPLRSHRMHTKRALRHTALQDPRRRYRTPPQKAAPRTHRTPLLTQGLHNPGSLRRRHNRQVLETRRREALLHTRVHKGRRQVQRPRQRLLHKVCTEQRRTHRDGNAAAPSLRRKGRRRLGRRRRPARLAATAARIAE
jgi:hypothetical protein